MPPFLNVTSCNTHGQVYYKSDNNKKRTIWFCSYISHCNCGNAVRWFVEVCWRLGRILCCHPEKCSKNCSSYVPANSANFNQTTRRYVLGQSILQTVMSSQRILHTAMSSQNILQTAMSSQSILQTVMSSQSILQTAISSQSILQTAVSSQSILQTAVSSQSILQTAMS